jgi:hypothetical protein
MPAKIVLVSQNTKSNALRNLANELTRRVGYRVWRVTPDRVRRRIPIEFRSGIDKVRQLSAFHGAGVSAPAFVTRLADVATLDSKKVVIRSLISASEGKGITICTKEECNTHAPLYTAYIPKKKEFRVHVWNNQVIDVQEKRKRRGADTEEHQVRNTANGYVFCRDNVVEPDDCRRVALAAVLSLGRTYGAVDVIWQEKSNKCFVLEVNSRPGMEGSTVTKYADAILRSI